MFCDLIQLEIGWLSWILPIHVGIKNIAESLPMKTNKA
jgi:hypothetical protein